MLAMHFLTTELFDSLHAVSFIPVDFNLDLFDKEQNSFLGRILACEPMSI